MGFAVPGLDDLRFHLAASGVGDVHLRVDAPGDDGTASTSAHDALPAATWPYPLDPRVSLEALRAPAEAERARAMRLEAALANAAAAAARVTDAYVFGEGGTIVEPSAPETDVAPTLPPLSPTVAGDAMWGGEARAYERARSAAQRDETDETDETAASDEDDEVAVGWRETARGADRRRRGAPADFVRGATTQQPFTPGGAGWEAAAQATARRRDAEAKRLSASWLAEFEADVFAGTPRGFAPSPWAESKKPFDEETRRNADFSFSGSGSVAGKDLGDDLVAEAPWTHDDLMMSALLTGADAHDDGDDDDDGSEAGSSAAADVSGDEDDFVSGDEDVDESAFEKNDGNDAFDDDVDAVLRSVRVPCSVRDGSRRVRREKGGSKNPTRKSERWAVMERLTDVDDAFRKVAPTPAMTFPFELDLFQKEAAYRLERGESVFVAAHTSAGKTAVAEYAFALATKHCTRAIYTSPIKTISNQKFRDFGKTFDVGLLTGDVSIKPDAPCLIMTTEILRSMLYRGADLIRDVEWVVFDEVHYVNDAERGVVWEEVIIMLPEHVGLVLLSATVPNVWEFADWVGRTKRKKVFVTGTNKRPVPLEHVLYFGGDKNADFHKVGERETFLPAGYKSAVDALNNRKKKDTGGGGGPAAGQGRGAGRGLGRGASKPTGNSGNKHPGRGGGFGGRGASGGASGGASSGARGRDKNAWVELIRALERRELLPMVTFAFSRRRIDAMVDSLTGLDLTTTAEKHDIHVFCERCLSRLSPGDRKLPQVLRVRELLRRGLGVHHAGLLPIVKEIVEMLFCRGVIKALFSTETFAMGVNAPARSVCFQDLKKHDGVDFRTLTPGEYTQMAGRAGRRGLDSVGTVIIAAWENFPTESQTRSLLTGRATKLTSQFRLTYGMILNLMRVEDLRVEDMLARSFAEFHAQRGMSDERAALALDAAALRKVRKLIDEESLADPTGWAAAEKHDEATFLSRAAAKQVRAAVLNSKGAQSAMTAGRVLLVANGGERLENGSESDDKSYADGVDKYGALLRVCDAEQRDGSRFKDPSESESGISYGAHAEGGEGGEGGSGSPSKTYVVLFACPEGHPERDDEMTSSGRFKRGDASAAIRADAETKTVLSLKPRGATGSDDVFRLSASSNSKKNHSADDSGRHSLPRGLPWRLVSGGASYVVAAVDADDVLAITGARVDVDANALLGETFTPGSGSDKSQDPPSASFAAAASRALAELERVCGKDACSLPAPLHPTKDLKLVDIASVEACLEHARLVSLVPPFPQTATREKRLAWRALLAARRRLVNRVGDREHSLSDANLQQMPDFEARVQVLQQMGYLDADRTVTLKGRVACEIATGDELVGAETIFAGVLTDVSPAAAAAVLSALVFQEKNASAPELESAPDLRDACARTFDLAVNAGTTQKSKGLPIDPPEYASSALKFGLCEVVHEWAKGAAFADVCSLTDVQEGSIVRTITRLDEMTRDVRNAARIMGDSALFEKMELASAAIKRDIVFSASLYVAGQVRDASS